MTGDTISTQNGSKPAEMQNVLNGKLEKDGAKAGPPSIKQKSNRILRFAEVYVWTDVLR